MKLTKTLLSGILIALFLVSMIPLSAQSGEVEIIFWYTENEAESPGVLDLVSQFNAEHDGEYEVIPERQSFFNAKEDFLTQYVGKKEPTIFRATGDWAVEFAQQELIQPVNSALNATDLNDFLDDALRLFTYPDKSGTEQIWGFPQLIDSPALFYNRHLVEEAGIDTSSWTTNTSMTWDEFVANATTVWEHTYATEEGSDGKPVYGFTFQGMFYGAQPAYFGHGARLFKNATVSFDNIDINSTEAREALQFIKDVVDADYTPAWAEQGWETINAFFTNGRVVFIQQGPWEIRNFLNDANEFSPTAANARPYASEDNLGIMRLPHDEDGNEGAPLGGHGYVISSRASGAVLDAALEFGKFMSSAEAMKDGAIDFYHVPARASVYEDTEVQASPAWKYIQTFKFIVDRSYKKPVDHRWAQLESVFGTELDNYLAGEETLDQFVKFVRSFWGEILLEGGSRQSDTDTSILNPFIIVGGLLGIFVLTYRRRKS